MEATPTARTWILVLVFVTGSAVSSLVAGTYSSEDACREAATATATQPRPSGLGLTTFCTPGE